MSADEYTAEEAREITSKATRSGLMGMILRRAQAGESSVMVNVLSIKDAMWLGHLGYTIKASSPDNNSFDIPPAYWTISWAKK